MDLNLEQSLQELLEYLLKSRNKHGEYLTLLMFFFT